MERQGRATVPAQTLWVDFENGPPTLVMHYEGVDSRPRVVDIWVMSGSPIECRVTALVAGGLGSVVNFNVSGGSGPTGARICVPAHTVKIEAITRGTVAADVLAAVSDGVVIGVNTLIQRTESVPAGATISNLPIASFAQQLQVFAGPIPPSTTAINPANIAVQLIDGFGAMMLQNDAVDILVMTPGLRVQGAHDVNVINNAAEQVYIRAFWLLSV